MERPLKELKLPVSKYTAKIATFLTHGEVKTIESKRLEGAEAEYVGDDIKVTKLSPNMVQKQNDALLSVGVKELIDDASNKLEVTQEIIDSLPNEDIKVLLKELRAVQAGIEEPSKKKS